jgi:glycine cleavage system H lipoate-binding protein
MRRVEKLQAGLGELPIGKIVLDPKSRDDIPKLLAGLQYIYVNPEIRKEVFAILQEVIPCKIDGKKVSNAVGRPGMEQWKILVLGVVRLGINADYDRLHELASQHVTLRQMLGHADWHNMQTYELQTLKDNLRLFTPELLDHINTVVVKVGHSLLKKGQAEVLTGRCDSFVVETDVHFPTDINLLYDAIRKTIESCADICVQNGWSEWRQYRYNLRQFKKLYRKIQRLRHSTSKDEDVKAAKKEEIKEAHRVYIEQANDYIRRSDEMRAKVIARPDASITELASLFSLDGYTAHARRQIDQICRRVLEGEKIPHEEKVFSIFEPHTEWISKGKAGVPVELGLRVCILEDQHQFILHHRVMEKQTDDQIAVSMVEKSQANFPDLRMVSFDKGFHSKDNRVSLEERLDLVAMPRKGKLSAVNRDLEAEPEFVRMRRKHSAVESAINGLENFGLDTCPDHGIKGFKRYVALAVLARNIHRLGVVVREKNARTRIPVPEPQKLAA